MVERRRREPRESQEEVRQRELAKWVPKTALGKKVLAGEISSMDEILKANKPIMESEIVDYLLPLEEKMIEFRKTTRVVRAGRKFSFRVAVLVGNKNGFVGLGTAKDTEKWPAVKKATRKAKLNLVRVRTGCGSWECTCGTGHSVPFKVTGKNASVRVSFLPAPRGTGLVAGDAIKDVLEFAGIRDVWAKVRGATDTRLNFAKAAIDALGKTTKMKVSNAIEKKGAKEQ
jgi:small subunit ribosomal protein S5